jgi:hypothetical protein
MNQKPRPFLVASGVPPTYTSRLPINTMTSLHLAVSFVLRGPASRPSFGPSIWSTGGSLHWSTSSTSPHARNRPLAAPKVAVVGYNRCCITIRVGDKACSLKQLTSHWANDGLRLFVGTHLPGSNSLRFSERCVPTWSNNRHRPSSSSQRESVCCHREAG